MAQKLATRHEMPRKVQMKTMDEDVWSLETREAKAVTHWLPINTARTVNGAWVSLAKLVGEEKARPIPFQGTSADLHNFEVLAMQVDIAVAAKLNIGTIFSGSLNWNDLAFYLDAMAYTDCYAETPGNYVYGTRWGVGLRVLLHVWDVKAGLSLNMGLVGAAAQLGFAKALYEINGIGIGVDGMTEVLGDLHTVGEFTAETYYKINDAVLPKLSEYLKTHKNELVPEPYQVQLIEPIDIDPLLGARAIVFAMKCLRDSKTLNEAIAKSAGKYDEHEILLVYAKMAGGTGPNDHPPDSAKEKAQEWLNIN